MKICRLITTRPVADCQLQIQNISFAMLYHVDDRLEIKGHHLACIKIPACNKKSNKEADFGIDQPAVSDATLFGFS
jgi:hypothetical protein